MAKKVEKKVNDIEVKDQEVVNPKIVKKPTKRKPKFPTKKHQLIKDITIGDKPRKKGEWVDLTEKGRVYFKQQFYIK